MSPSKVPSMVPRRVLMVVIGNLPPRSWSRRVRDPVAWRIVSQGAPTGAGRYFTVVSYRTPAGTGTAWWTVTPCVPSVRIEESTATKDV